MTSAAATVAPQGTVEQDAGQPSAFTRGIVTAALLMAAFMTQLDGTIANVALPHMQASTAASREQVTWVLTSYLITAAVFTPLSGWLATRYGQKRVMLASVIGFTVASMLCGVAANFSQLIAFRLLQGMMGAAILPISQAILLDINPPERHGSAMAAWGMGAVLGPIVGPVLGGYLTDYFSWRWIFFINLPFGVLASLGLIFFMREHRTRERNHLDLTGFALLAIAVASFQLMLDRGQTLDWFNSTEIIIEATVSGAALYMFIVHTLTSDRPFIKPVLFKDFNYVLGNFYAFILGGLLFGTMALTPPLLAELMGYPIKLVGLVSAPRGISIMITMMVTGRLLNYIDSRVLIGAGLLVSGISMHYMSGISLDMDSRPIIIAGVVQGIGAGLMFVPVTTTIFTTLSPELRNEGAATSSLFRGLSGSICISVLHTMTIRNSASVQSRLVETVTPDNPAMTLRAPDFDFQSVESVMHMNVEVFRQAMMVSYVNTFWALYVACLVAIPLTMLLRR
ncbi:MAG: DHA2 family efflux MFS transporter permease subunit [Novosphingobium sp.]|nr:DHA2 family efflux MFS transporter permease subunit [Novosphingobium sp.]